MKKVVNNNDVLVISHIADADGMGSIILGKKFYGDIDYILCETRDLVEVFKDDFSSYKVVYVCDLPISKDAINVIEENLYLKEHIKHFDHHESMVSDDNPDYINEVIKLDGIGTSGTYLFYKYLCSLDKKIDKEFYHTFVEAVRAYDIWDFNGNFKLGKRITSLFGILGIDLFIKTIISLDDTKDFILPDIYEELIDNDEIKMMDYIDKVSKNLCVCDYDNKKMAVLINEQYRSILGNEVCKRKPDVDFALIINFERMSCSLRTTRDDIDLGHIASCFHHNGGGHLKSAGFAIDKESMPKLKKYINSYLENI